ncbi:carbonic anhydrase [Leucobacter sp. OLJS4]|uniref:carbonic anhydrase n=1 Tax=unclassified Leucobacter TaxID=2621730 RepID=UPI000C1A406B|nr:MULTISPECIES: carbonic anhydrase [unclassified Leucobacter]PIJ55584.1 carbonic anhydrase [Leucobacter sp. OLES1]PII84453.1 carbonic anhydrase [Leucobacter sp. OLCALW19]PII88690.1 carbonic anhydrase [Leucobacter sp. OLTLW20]PII90952.1 carbonic anhydrase [Leucobacter sp. OLAS13]PII97699.1 carbonic anhydrase [Leucobacter sp. OLDS2]
MSTPRVTPQQAWDAFIAGNERFVSGVSKHPNQDVERRSELVNSQEPDVALFGCSDSRLAAEIIFDCGLGDLFIARNMGHVVAESITASMEYAVSALGASLIVVLAHDSCGAVAAAIDQSSRTPSPVTDSVRNTLAPIQPSVQQFWLRDRHDTPYAVADEVDANAIGRIHLATTVNELLRTSRTISDAVDRGELGIVGCQYRLTEGRAVPYTAVGPLALELAPLN